MTVIQLRVDELTTEQLDHVVRNAEGDWTLPSPSQAWSVGGPIIERERIETRFDVDQWHSVLEHPARADGVQRSFQSGPTPLVAAMRAYVVSKFGETVEMPV